MLALAIPVGLLIGVVMGTLGAGGSIIAVPVLVYAFGHGAREATTGSLVVVGLAAVVSAAHHGRGGRVRLGTGLVFGGLGAAGSVLGSRLSAVVPERLLLALFAGLLVVVAVLMARRRRREGGQAPPDEPAPVLTPRPFAVDWGRAGLLLAAASGVGLLTGFFGVGGGFAVVPALVLLLGLPMPTAVGTSLVVIAVNCAVAFASRLGQRVDLDAPLILTFTAAAITGSLLGSRVAQRLGHHRLSGAFVVLLVLVAGYVAVESLIQAG